jgi:hypothetical protein
MLMIPSSGHKNGLPFPNPFPRFKKGCNIQPLHDTTFLAFPALGDI